MWLMFRRRGRAKPDCGRHPWPYPPPLAAAAGVAPSFGPKASSEVAAPAGFTKIAVEKSVVSMPACHRARPVAGGSGPASGRGRRGWLAAFRRRHGRGGRGRDAEQGPHLGRECLPSHCLALPRALACPPPQVELDGDEMTRVVRLPLRPARRVPRAARQPFLRTLDAQVGAPSRAKPSRAVAGATALARDSALPPLIRRSGA